jgi:hypothetical protein
MSSARTIARSTNEPAEAEAAIRREPVARGHDEWATLAR